MITKPLRSLIIAAESSSFADPLIMEVKMAMNQILDFTKDYDYSDEKIKEFRKILKGSLTLVKSMATNEVVMDSVAIDFRETLGKATEQMIFFISGMDFIRAHRISTFGLDPVRSKPDAHDLREAYFRIR